MPLKNIELTHGSRNDTWVWRIVIPADKKRAWRPRLCWVNKKPFAVGEKLYFYRATGNFPFKEERLYLSSSLEELIAVAQKYERYDNFKNDVFSFRYKGEDIRHYAGRKKAEPVFKKQYSPDKLF